MSAGAAPERADREAHLFVVRDTPDERAALAASGARTIAAYGSFTLVEAAGDDAARLRDAGSDERDDMRSVRLRGRAVDPSSERPSLLRKRDAAIDAPALTLVQFVGPVKDAWLERVRGTGVDVVTYVPQNGYLVHGSARALRSLARLAARDPAVRAVAELPAGDKLAPGVPQRGRGTFEVHTLPGSAGAAARDALAGAARSVRRASRQPGLHVEFVAADAARVRELAADPGVVAVLPYVEPKLLDERAAQIVAGNLTASHQPTGTGYLAWLAARGFATSGVFDFAIDVTDEGVDTEVLAGSHPDFYDEGDTANPSRMAYKTNWTQDADARDCGGHGTNVASIAAGYNDVDGNSDLEDASGFNYGLGVAPRAQIGASKIFRCNNAFDLNGSSLTDVAANAYAGGARVSNNSWGADVLGLYTADSREYDFRVRDAQPGVGGNQELVEVFANGNAGPGPATVGSPATAKNVIAVGASENVRPIGFTDGCGVSDAGANSARDIIGFSSRGPTSDGRTKPDVVAPGTHVTGAQPQVGGSYDGDGTCNSQFPAGSALYSLVSGTSQATPEASGMAALVRDWYRRTHGGGTTPPSPAMTKALMVNTARDLAGGVDAGVNDGADATIGAVPSQSQGWGRIDMGEVLDGTARDLVDQSQVFGSTGQLFRRSFTVADPSRPVRVSLVWTDAPGPTVGESWVNDLDLALSDGSTYRGNVIAGGQSVAGGSADRRNNVENVLLPAGRDGVFSVEVTAANIAGDGVPGNGDATDQDFALVVSNATPASAPVLGHESASASEAGGDGDGIVEPGDTIAIEERLRNAGDATATGVSGTLASGTPGVTVTGASSAFPDIAPGGTAAASTPFRATVANEVPCGAPLSFSLAVTRSGGGQASVPFQVQTGRPGPKSLTTSANVPRGIPDGSVAGTSSTVTLGGSGRISDVDVRVRITHPWIGDVRVQLVAPDGVTVTLADRPGGTFNDGGGNGLDTTFDDEASTRIGASGTAAPWTGRVRPQADQLARLDGRPINGTWTLRVADLATPDAGTLTAWGPEAGAFECPAPANAAPTAAFTAGPSPALAGQTVSFDASGSSDPDGTIARYQWDLDGDGSFETDTGAVPAAARAYGEPASRSVGLRVTDDDGATAETTRTLDVRRARDTTRPRVSLSRLSSVRISRLLARRTTVRATCNERCTMTFRLTVRVRQPGSRRARTVTVARGRARVTRARRVVRARIVPTRAGRRTLPRLRSARATLTARAVDGARNARSVRRVVRLRR